MSKTVPGPPVLQIRPNLCAEEATQHACEHLASAVRMALHTLGAPPGTAKLLTESVIHQVDVARMLLDRALNALPDPR
ncbi:MAG: hypothetical protein RR517_31310 [Pseudomonas sp.]